jgi:hypothetical protein
MSKSKKLVGQPILSQILSCISTNIIKQSSNQHKSNRYYKHISGARPFGKSVILLYGVFSYCNGLRELCEGMLACEGRLTHLGLNKAPARKHLVGCQQQTMSVSFFSMASLKKCKFAGPCLVPTKEQVLNHEEQQKNR